MLQVHQSQNPRPGFTVRRAVEFIQLNMPKSHDVLQDFSLLVQYLQWVLR